MSHPGRAASEVTISNLSTYEISDLTKLFIDKTKRWLFNYARGPPVWLFSSLFNAFFACFLLNSTSLPGGQSGTLRRKKSKKRWGGRVETHLPFCQDVLLPRFVSEAEREGGASSMGVVARRWWG